MKYLHKFFNSNLIVEIRNRINFRPVNYLYKVNENFIASDLSIWRLDNGYSTIFKASNILEKFYDCESYLKFVFFDKEGKFIKSVNCEFRFGFSELLIDFSLLKREDYGTFYVLNLPKKPATINFKVTNRCYVGYGKEEKFSMVHGNLVGVMSTPSPKFKTPKNIRSAVSARKGNFHYYIQKKLCCSVNHFLLFSNPMKRIMTLKIQGQDFFIKPMGCAIIKIQNTKKPIRIDSDFFQPRPILESSNKDYYDFHHC